MQKRYWYFVSQLPALRENESAISERYFFDLCARFLPESEKKIALSLSVIPPKDDCDTGSAFLNSWYGYERNLRFALAALRAKKMNKKIGAFSGAAFVRRDIAMKAKEALSFSDPLDAEKFLYQARLSFLDGIKPLDGFSLDAIFEYGIRLLLFLRMKKFTADAGRASYKKNYESILGE